MHMDTKEKGMKWNTWMWIWDKMGWNKMYAYGYGLKRDGMKYIYVVGQIKVIIWASSDWNFDVS